MKTLDNRPIQSRKTEGKIGNSNLSKKQRPRIKLYLAMINKLRFIPIQQNFQCPFGNVHSE